MFQDFQSQNSPGFQIKTRCWLKNDPTAYADVFNIANKYNPTQTTITRLTTLEGNVSWTSSITYILMHRLEPYSLNGWDTNDIIYSFDETGA